MEKRLYHSTRRPAERSCESIRSTSKSRGRKPGKKNLAGFFVSPYTTDTL